MGSKIREFSTDLAKLATRFSHTSKLGKIIRSPLGLMPNNRIVPIMGGINRGMKWITGTGPNRACWLGNYEADHLAALPRLVKRGMVAYDAGANAGYYTLALSGLVGPQGHVFAFEPEAANVSALRRHVSLNRLTNVTVVQAAVSESQGIVGFDSPNSAMGNIVSHGSYFVPSISLNEFIRSNPAPQFMKMDIEGAELGALRGASEILRAKPVICLATHSPDLHDACTHLLRSFGYAFTPFDETGSDFVAN